MTDKAINIPGASLVECRAVLGAVARVAPGGQPVSQDLQKAGQTPASTDGGKPASTGAAEAEEQD
jgi:hypothetical protein